jgi:Holliday junction resolvase RusA-like endonuclease
VVGELSPKPPRLAQFLVIRIEGRPPTPNARRHWHLIARDNAVWKDTAKKVAEQAVAEWEAKHGLRWRTVRRASVSVAFGLPDKRRRDLDNLIASCKPLIDGIVDAGVIVDDSIDVITVMEFGAVVNGTTETVITIEDAEG